MPLLPFHGWQKFTLTIATGVYKLPYMDSGKEKPLPPPDGKETHSQATPSSRWEGDSLPGHSLL